ncbi:hypothetical protein [Paenibacillus sp. 1001270B_150601_E10]|uniref:hypothetical protein n=1 Tax=Paenibacillus sp. 1001270B_150601_E10 TaxID=2787079 RepID=UPI0018A07822|nr:hypothetical protein [Paenibacillus sp. 1001270B_150601_E10]
MDASTTLIFIILAFVLGAVLVWKKDTIPSPMRRWLSIFALIFIAFAFFLIVYSFATAGL